MLEVPLPPLLTCGPVEFRFLFSLNQDIDFGGLHNGHE